MITLGIDPGTRKLGWGVVRREGAQLIHVAHGVIKTNERDGLGARLEQIAEELNQVLGTHSPDVGSVETLFFYKDAQAAAKLGHARGVVLLCLAQKRVEIAEYAPAKVKRTIAGSGQAEKVQVARVIKSLLGLNGLPEPDAADALALAVTHLRIAPFMQALAGRSPAQRTALAALLGGKKRRRKAGG